MSASNNNEAGFLSNPTVRVIGALVLLAGALGYGWSTIHHFSGGMPPKPFNPLSPPAAASAAASATGAGATPLPPHMAELLRSTIPTVAERRTIMNDMMGKVAASTEQRKKIEDIWITGFQNPDTLFDRIHESEKVLTEQQLRTLAPYFTQVVASRVARLSKVMTSRDFVTLNQRLFTALTPPQPPASAATQPLPAPRR